MGTDDRFIIEHETRGILLDIEHDPYGTTSATVHLEWRSRWSPTKLRSEGMVLHGRRQLNMVWSRLSPRLRRNATARRFGSWTEVPDPEATPEQHARRSGLCNRTTAEATEVSTPGGVCPCGQWVSNHFVNDPAGAAR